MSKPEFLYVTYIETTAEKLWQALTDSEFTRRYWWGTDVVSDWKVGSPFKLVTNGTDNHLIQIDMMTSFDVTGREAQDILDSVGLTANCNAIPNDTLPPFRPSGLRLGTPAITTRGLGLDHMALVAEWMHQAIVNRKDEAKLNGLRNQVQEFALQFPLPSDNS